MVAVGTAIMGEGRVVFRDCTAYGLERMCVAVKDKYPDLETWAEMVSQGRNVTAWRHRYTEKQTDIAFFGYLWIYWKEEL